MALAINESEEFITPIEPQSVGPDLEPWYEPIITVAVIGGLILGLSLGVTAMVAWVL